MGNNLIKLNIEAGKGIRKLMTAGIGLSEIFQYDLTEEQKAKFKTIIEADNEENS